MLKMNEIVTQYINIVLFLSICVFVPFAKLIFLFVYNHNTNKFIKQDILMIIEQLKFKALKIKINS